MKIKLLEYQLKSKAFVNRPVSDAAINSDGNLAVVASGNDVLLIDLNQEGTRISIPYSNSVQSVAVSANGNKIAASMVYRGCYTQVWRVSDILNAESIAMQSPQNPAESTVAPLFEITKKHQDLVHDLAFSADGKWLATAGHEAEVGIWDATNGSSAHFFEPYTPARTVCFSDNGKYVAFGTGTREGRLLVRTLSSGKEKQNINTGRGGGIGCLDFARDSKSIVAGCRDCTVRQYKLTRKTPTFSTQMQTGIKSVKNSFDGNVIFVGHSNGNVAILDHQTGEQLHSFQAHSSAICNLFSLESSLVTVSESGEIKVWA